MEERNIKNYGNLFNEVYPIPYLVEWNLKENFFKIILKCSIGAERFNNYKPYWEFMTVSIIKDGDIYEPYLSDESKEFEFENEKYTLPFSRKDFFQLFEETAFAYSEFNSKTDEITHIYLNAEDKSGYVKVDSTVPKFDDQRNFTAEKWDKLTADNQQLMGMLILLAIWEAANQESERQQFYQVLLVNKLKK